MGACREGNRHLSIIEFQILWKDSLLGLTIQLSWTLSVNVLGIKVIYDRKGIPVSATLKEDDQDRLRYMIQYETDGCMEIREY